VLSVNRFNQGKADLVMVLPVTSRFKRIASHVKIPAGEAALISDSYIKCEEVRCISKQRLTRRWGEVEAATMRSVEQFVRLILGL
jgi:mRNA interferase MazF